MTGFDPARAVIAVAILGLLIWSLWYLLWHTTRPLRRYVKSKKKRPGYINDPFKR